MDDDDEFWALSPDAPNKVIQDHRKKRKGGKGGGESLTKRQIQEVATEAVCTTISALIIVDPPEQEEGPSMNTGDSFGSKRNQIRVKIMKLKSLASGSMAQTKKSIMDSLEIN
jgi:hypothetical protein